MIVFKQLSQRHVYLNIWGYGWFFIKNLSSYITETGTNLQVYQVCQDKAKENIAKDKMICWHDVIN